ncbi:MAG: hypothetical protein ACRES2_09880 [Steroidobacteraceae bacterium]
MNAYAPAIPSATSSFTASPSAVSWAAVFAGATGAAVLTMVLMVLGSGLGFAAISPWSGRGASAQAIGTTTIAWITITQLLAAGFGGYIAGRLRTAWVGLHTDEAYFRDTAHGFLAWGVATLLIATLLASTVTNIVTGTAKAGAAVATSVAGAGGASNDNSFGYFVDSLFRPTPSQAPAAVQTRGSARPASVTANNANEDSAASARAQATEVTRIFVNALSAGTLSEGDTQYVASIVSRRTGMSSEDAQRRVSDTFNALKADTDRASLAARTAADRARKAAAYASLWLVVSLLIGAFIASLAATQGGKRRDAIPT